MAGRVRKYTADYYLDSVGRRRKLSAGAMKDICRLFGEGVSTADLAEQYGVSRSMILTVTYWTPRKSDLERIQEGVHHTLKKPENP